MNPDFTIERTAYGVLSGIYSGGAYSSIELDRALDIAPPQARGKITALVYGVLDKSARLDYVISSVAERKVKTGLSVLLKMGLYELLYGSEPDYAVVSRYVAFAKKRMSGVAGFVNAVLRRAKGVTVPDGGSDPASLALKYSRPEWAVRRLVEDFGDRAEKILSAGNNNLTHIRRNGLRIGREEFDNLIVEKSKNEQIIRTKFGYYVTHSTLRALDPKLYTAQSISSVMAAGIFAENLPENARVLDLCAAPGGKAIYIKELLPLSSVTACDVHPHRVNLIRSYADRMGADIKVMQNDATKIRAEWKNSFDAVICDVPCTGSGLINSSPDILLFKKDEDVAALASLQQRILTAAAEYVEPGGVLAYSTCSLFRAEDEAVVSEFLAAHDTYSAEPTGLPYGETKDGLTRFFPDTHGCDGFFVAKMRRAK